MKIYPGDPKPEFDPYSTMEKDKVNVTRITLGSHTGTHVDAPWHFLPNGNTVDEEPLSKFLGEALIIDASERRGLGIRFKDLDRYSDVMRDGDILLIYTGAENRTTKFAFLDISAAEWMVKNKVKCVGIDTLSVEKFGSKDAPVHKLLLSNRIGIIENLDRLKAFVNTRMFLVCLPLRLQDLDGSPARAVLFEIIK